MFIFISNEIIWIALVNFLVSFRLHPLSLTEAGCNWLELQRVVWEQLFRRYSVMVRYRTRCSSVLLQEYAWNRKNFMKLSHCEEKRLWYLMIRPPVYKFYVYSNQTVNNSNVTIKTSLCTLYSKNTTQLWHNLVY